jgi:hypothetical protein
MEARPDSEECLIMAFFCSAGVADFGGQDIFCLKKILTFLTMIQPNKTEMLLEAINP